jgi:phospholipid/cholesterol/gamma-HCH transport system substrate-binding protein/paraquat-inducible protein B
VFLDPSSYPPPVVTIASTGPYIPSAPGTFSRITEDVTTIATQLRKADVGKVVDRVNTLLVSVDKTVNDLQMADLRKQVGLIMANLDASTKQLNKIINDPKIDGIVKNASDMVASAKGLVGGEDVKKAAADLPKITGRLNSAVDRVDGLVHGPDLQEILDNVRKTTGSTAVAGEEARRALRTLDEMLLAEQQNIVDAIADLHSVLENAEALTSELKTNPSRIIFGKPPPRIQSGADK